MALYYFSAFAERTLTARSDELSKVLVTAYSARNLADGKEGSFHSSVFQKTVEEEYGRQSLLHVYSGSYSEYVLLHLKLNEIFDRSQLSP